MQKIVMTGIAVSIIGLVIILGADDAIAYTMQAYDDELKASRETRGSEFSWFWTVILPIVTGTHLRSHPLCNTEWVV
ncbi:MAG: hypothetical protein OEN23_17990 [Paracoccaceae bacterium]|nr:hypothetical protein [Paracoccaceae bacterium]